MNNQDHFQALIEDDFYLNHPRNISADDINSYGKQPQDDSYSDESSEFSKTDE